MRRWLVLLFSKVYTFEMRKVKRITELNRKCTLICITNCLLLFAKYLKTSVDAKNAITLLCGKLSRGFFPISGIRVYGLSLLRYFFMKPFYYAGNKAGAYSLALAICGIILFHLYPFLHVTTILRWLFREGLFLSGSI